MMEYYKGVGAWKENCPSAYRDLKNYGQSIFCMWVTGDGSVSHFCKKCDTGPSPVTLKVRKLAGWKAKEVN